MRRQSAKASIFAGYDLLPTRVLLEVCDHINHEVNHQELHAEFGDLDLAFWKLKLDIVCEILEARHIKPRRDKPWNKNPYSTHSELRSLPLSSSECSRLVADRQLVRLNTTATAELSAQEIPPTGSWSDLDDWT